MKNKFTLIYKIFAFVLFACLFINFSSFPPNGLTGAPGDGTCNNCHFGGTQTGSVDIEGIDNPVVSNTTYNVTVRITLASGSSTRAGFEFVALDGNVAGSSSVGTFSNLGTNVTTSASGSRTYAKHSGSENTYSGNEVTYTFDWTSPASSVNNLSFYATGNIANGSGTGGDLIVFDSDTNIQLPVDLVDFKAKALEKNLVELNWSTASESNSDYFEILRSEDGRNYESIGEVQAAGFSDDLKYYTFQDKSPILNKNSFYRLKQFDFDGQFAYSAIEAIQAMSFDEFHLNVFPNPARNNECLFIDYLSSTRQPDARIQIFDIYGRSMVEDPQFYAGFEKGFNKVVIDIKNFPVGQYFVSISNNGSFVANKPFIVVK